MVTDAIDLSSLTNLQIRLAARPTGLPKPADWNLARQAVASPGPGGVLVNRARMEGIVVFDWADRYGEAVSRIAQWMREGKFRSREDIVDGLANFPATLNLLFSGGNFGKLVLKVADA